MKTVATVAELRRKTRRWRLAGERIGLAPTMGNLHAGHLSLVDALRRQGARRIVVSLFVNPTQFGPGEDFARYPRSFDTDREKLAASGVDLLFAPAAEEVYPPDEAPAAIVDVPALSADLCGAVRPGHFTGVATVVAKLFNMAGPDLAAFGEKDYQQLVIIRQMSLSLAFPVEIVATPTVRDADGLALSSRNQYLAPGERTVAPELYRALLAARDGLISGQAIAAVEGEARRRLEQSGFRIDYVSVRRARDLAVPEKASGALVVLAAAHLGSTRLIDNLPVALPEAQ